MSGGRDNVGAVAVDMMHLTKVAADTNRKLRLSVVVATYRRIKDLTKCLDGLENQKRDIEQICVVCHENDTESADLVKSRMMYWDRLGLAFVGTRSVVRAMRMGLHHAKHDIVAFIDDDAVPATDWASRMMAHFEADRTIGGVGGRDRLMPLLKLNLPKAKEVGIVRAWGQIVGNHHLGCDGIREVDFLKGVNMAFRRDCLTGITWPMMLKGEGAEAHHEIYICTRIKQKKTRLIYDPSIVVDHYIAERKAGMERRMVSKGEYRVDNFNLAVALRAMPWNKRVMCSIFRAAQSLLGASREIILRRDIHGAIARLAGMEEFVRTLMVEKGREEV